MESCQSDLRAKSAGGLVLDERAGAPADLGSLATLVGEAADEAQQRVGLAPLLGDGAPVHRRAHRHASLAREVLDHADLVAVEQHRRPGEREQQRPRHAQARAVAAEHRRRAAADAVPVDPHVLARREGGEDLVALGRFELVERELVVVAQEGAPTRVAWRHRQAPDQILERRRLAAREREPQALVDEEAELQVQRVAVVVEVATRSRPWRRSPRPSASRRRAGAWRTRAGRAASACPRRGRRRGGPTSSTRKGTASIRKPDAPSASQKPTIFAISSRTAGLAMFRSGWKGAKLWL